MLTGSYISNLMCWRDLDVGLLVGADYSPRDVLRLISRVMELPGWHRELHDSITDEQRAAVLRIKDVWFRLPSYSDQIGGHEIYPAVTKDCVRTPGEFRSWLADRELPVIPKRPYRGVPRCKA